MLKPDRYLAAVLGEIPDADLAIAIGALPTQVWKLRLARCGRPRSTGLVPGTSTHSPTWSTQSPWSWSACYGTWGSP